MKRHRFGLLGDCLEVSFKCCIYCSIYHYCFNECQAPRVILLSLLQQCLWQCVTMQYIPCPRARRWSLQLIIQLLLNKTRQRYCRLSVLEYKICTVNRDIQCAHFQSPSFINCVCVRVCDFYSFPWWSLSQLGFPSAVKCLCILLNHHR